MKKIILVIIILVVVAVIFFVINKKRNNVNLNNNSVGNKMNIEYKSMSFEDMYKAIEGKNQNEYVILDVRMEEEFKQGRLENSILISDYEIQKVLDKIPNKDTLIFVYCRSGARSKKSTIKMNEMGYTNVYDIGGIMYYNGKIISD